MSAQVQSHVDPLRTVHDFLDQQKTAVVAVTTPQGNPWAIPVFYANDGAVLWWLTKPSSRLGSALLESGHAVVCVLADAPRWHDTRGLQLEGKAELVTSRRGQFSATRRYLRKHAALARQLLSGGGRSDVLRRAADMRFFRFEPSACWFTDNSRGFGHRFELSLNGRDGRG